MSLYIERVRENAVVPSRATPGAAGYDLTAALESPVIIVERGRAVIPIGWKISVPPGTYGRIAPRSGLTVKQGLDIGAGVIDSDYRGEVQVVVFNHGSAPVAITSGQKIAQLILEVITTPEVVERSLDDTARGHNGFGSTGY